VETKIENLKNASSDKDASKKALAIKLELMRLKSKAKGEVSIPSTERLYFLVYLPPSLNVKSVAVFVSKQWSVGRTIDFIATTASVPNSNNVSTAKKLRLFHKSSGKIVSEDLSLKLIDLIDEKGSLYSGESLQLEYVNASQ